MRHRSSQPSFCVVVTPTHAAVSQNRHVTTTPAQHAAQLMERIQQGPIRSGAWHWLDANFDPALPGFVLVGAPTVLALATVDQYMPGFADEQLKRLESFGGREKNLGDYRQIVSWYAELLVIGRLVEHDWPAAASFEMEPVAGDSNYNPEVVVRLEALGSFGVEVKAPDLIDHNGKRTANRFQLTARTELAGMLDGDITYPRDNPVKDFLVHAEKKFAGFRAADPDFRSLLVIVWDDYINEPLAALTAPGSGLLTSNSFHQVDGVPVTYPNVDAVLLVRHQHQFINGLAWRPLHDGREHLLDYGQRDQFPFNALVANPTGRTIPEEFLLALHAWPVEHLVGAEYSSSELVMWSDVPSVDRHPEA